MIEETIVKYLNRTLDVSTYAEVPEKAPEYFCVVEKTGGGMKNYIQSAVITVESYGKSLMEAAELNEKVKIAMEKITALQEVCKCSLNSDYNFTDAETKRYRYQAVFDIVFY